MGNRELEEGCRGEELPCGPHYFPAVNVTRTFSHPGTVDWREERFVVETKRPSYYSDSGAVNVALFTREIFFLKKHTKKQSHSIFKASFGRVCAGMAVVWGSWEILVFYFLSLMTWYMFNLWPRVPSPMKPICPTQRRTHTNTMIHTNKSS